jgi:hypothetical protein
MEIEFSKLPIRTQISFAKNNKNFEGKVSEPFKRFDAFCNSLIVVPDQTSQFKQSLTKSVNGIPVTFNSLLWICTFNSIFISSHYLMPMVYLNRDKNEFKCNYFPEIMRMFRELQTETKIGLVFPTIVYSNRDMNENHMTTIIYEKEGDSITLTVIDSSGMGYNYLETIKQIFPHSRLNLEYNIHGQTGGNCTLTAYLWGILYIFNRPLKTGFNYLNVYKTLITLILRYEEETVGSEPIPQETLQIFNERWSKLIRPPNETFTNQLKFCLNQI